MRKECILQEYHEAFAPSARIKEGSIHVKGQDITCYREKEMQKLRGRIFSMIFQDPMTSLNPTIKIGKQIAEAVLIHNKNYTKEQVNQKVLELMELVGISHPKERYHQYPCSFPVECARDVLWRSHWLLIRIFYSPMNRPRHWM